MSALAGVRVLDFSGHFASAMAAMHLGDLGAEVIKVDPTADERGRAEPGYLAWNRNKRCLVLDLLRPQDLAEAKRLIADADVVIFDTPPGGLEELGLDGATLTGLHDHLIHVWAPPYGERGRWSSLPASHHLLAAVTGISRAQSSYSGAPVHLISPQAYYGQANGLAIAIGAALYERVHSGRGQAVVVSGLHGAALVMPTTRFDGQRAAVWSAPVGGAPNYRLYECADGQWLFLGALFEAIYLRALEATGTLVEVLSDPMIDGDLRARRSSHPVRASRWRSSRRHFARSRVPSGSPRSRTPTCRAGPCPRGRSGSVARPSLRTACACSCSIPNSAPYRCPASRSG